MTLERTAKRLRADEHDYIPNSDSDKRDDSLHSAAVLSLPLSGSREAIYDDSDRKGNSEDIPRVFKRLPGSPWLIVQTTLNHVFYYNPETRAKTWDLPPEVEDIVGELIALAMIPHDAEEESFAEDEYESAHEDEQERDDQEEEEGRNDMEDATQPIETDAEPSIPLKEREDAFKALLREKNVSPYGAWDSEVAKIQDDERFEYLSQKEKKAIFDQFCVERAAELMKERADGSSATKTDYTALMTASVNPKMDWAEFSRRFKRHPAFMAVPIKEREPLFEEYVKEAKKREIEKKQEEVRESKLAFVTLLQTLTPAALKSTWKRAKKEIDSDPRYKRLKASSDREELFLEYIKNQESLLSSLKKSLSVITPSVTSHAPNPSE